MNHALCGRPWILSGQTLVVQKWRPDFDPMIANIGKMALCVRICGLPVKLFKNYTIAAIGKIFGTVVKVDQVTIGQARGKFAHVCIEVDLSKPLRPFVEVEGVAYGVFYDGISIICFECGCYGHVKDKCPYVHQDNGSKDQINEAVINENISVLKGDMGSWMLMTYKNKKKVSTENGSTKKVQISGSRFNVLQDQNGDEHTDNGDSATVDNFQDKALKSIELKIISGKVVEKSKDKQVMNEKTQRLKAKVPTRLSMKDVSNKVSGSSSNRSNATVKYQRKHRAINSLGVTNLDPHVSFVVSQEK
ncbi:uncharacterized protein LOC112203614 [Rosa chinensis]|uniref:uncharacterized protein LOC112203614 n=1 Tax=Rosa chinensis TaxID=74649 RepID=UPI000D0876B3|nr:uncharacterized protein LOC112203614 [Rosa chinensis]